jgi:predicted metal-dependent hydrolase
VTAGSDRDRDQSGRPRNARPRDALGRPLPPGSQGVPRISEDLVLSADDTLDYAQRLLNDGMAFHAHEVFEAAWKNGPDTERELWQALAQLAVGLTHIQRGNCRGATALLRRAGERLGNLPAPLPHGIADNLAEYAESIAAEVEAGTDIPQDRLTPNLRT